MSSSEKPAIRVTGLSKCYLVYSRPQDRLKQWIIPRLQRLAGLRQKPYFHEFWALHDVTLDISRGQTVGIIGRNGSGKSTLLQLICGTLNPTGGLIETQGRVAALLELGSGFNPEFTGRENVYMNASVLGLSKDKIDSRFQQIVDFADIGEFIDQPVKAYSSGMMVRLAFAVIAHVDADILIVDEALSVGDAFFTQKCMRFLRSFMEKGTVLFVSHDTSSVINLCDQVVWLERGRVLEIGLPKTVCGHYLEAFYEAQQGKSSATRLEPASPCAEGEITAQDQAKDDTAKPREGARRTFEFDPTAESFGKGGGKIQNAYLLDRNGKSLSWVAGGEQVILRVIAKAHEPLDSPIIGFLIKDRLGQALFGENTFQTFQDRPIHFAAGAQIQTDFVFVMPLLRSGDYSITIALAEGTTESHAQHHWIHDAAVFRCEAGGTVNGLIGISMIEINMQESEMAG
jgi:lipopolysaccharide transport system ATP-binding protein